MIRLSRLAPVPRALLGSVGAGVAGQAALLVSGILAARILGVENRGHLALLLIVPVLVAVFGGLGLSLATTFEIARNPAIARPLLRRHWRAVAVLTLLLTVLDAVILLALFGREEPQAQLAAVISLPAVPAITALQFGLSIFQGQQRFRAFNLVRLAPSVVYALLLVALALAASATLPLVTASFVGSFVLIGAGALVVAVRGTARSAADGDVPPLGELVRFGRRSVLGSVSPSDGGGVDQAIVGVFLPRTALGLYVVALAFTNLPRLVSQSIGMVAYPNVASRAEQLDARRAMWRFVALGAGVSIAVVIALEIAIGRLIPWLFGEPFADAVPVTRILLLAVLFSGARRILGDAARGANQPLAGTIGELASWIVLIPALIVLTPLFETRGVAVALVASSLTSLLVVIWRVQRPPRKSRAPRPRLRSPIRRGRDAHLALTCGLIVAAGAAGILPVVTSPKTVLLVCLALGWALVVNTGRAIFVNRRAASAADDHVSPSPADPRLRVPRALYLLGVLFVGALVLRPAAGFTLSDLFFLAALGWTAMELALRRGQMPFLVGSRLIIGLLLFALGGVLSSTLSGHPVESISVVVRLAYITIVWFWLGTVLLETPRHLMMAVTAWVVSISISGLTAVAQYSLGDIFHYANALPGRYPGLAEHVNDLGGAAGIALVPALIVVSTSGNRWFSRLSGLAMLVLVVAAIVLTGSVGGFMAAVMGLIVWFSSQRMRRRSAQLIVPALVCAIVVVTVSAGAATSSPLDRLREPSGPASASSTLSLRTATIDAAWQRIRKDPIVGVGLDLPSRSIPITSPSSQKTYPYQVHNILIGSWYSAGILGLVGIVVMLAGVLAIGLRCLLAARTDEESLVAVGLTGSAVSSIAFAMGAPVLFQRYAWISAALLLVLRAQQTRRDIRVSSHALDDSGSSESDAPRARPTAALTPGAA